MNSMVLPGRVSRFWAGIVSNLQFQPQRASISAPLRWTSWSLAMTPRWLFIASAAAAAAKWNLPGWGANIKGSRDNRTLLATPCVALVIGKSLRPWNAFNGFVYARASHVCRRPVDECAIDAGTHTTTSASSWRSRLIWRQKIIWPVDAQANSPRFTWRYFGRIVSFS